MICAYFVNYRYIPETKCLRAKFMIERKKKKDRDRDRINVKGVKNKGELRTSKDGAEGMAQRLIA